MEGKAKRRSVRFIGSRSIAAERCQVIICFCLWLLFAVFFVFNVLINSLPLQNRQSGSVVGDVILKGKKHLWGMF